MNIFDNYNLQGIDRENPDDIHVIFIISGFCIKGIDQFSPIVFQSLKDNFHHNNSALMCFYITRWNFQKEDNLSYKDQKKLIIEQIKYHLTNIKKKFGNIYIYLHGIFESYGGKIGIRVIYDMISENILHDFDNVKWNKLFLIHSPLYGHEICQVVLKNKFKFWLLHLLLKKCISDNLILNLLSPFKYKYPYKIMAYDSINNIKTKNIISFLNIHDVHILHIIGFPNEIQINDKIINIESFSTQLNNCNTLLKNTLKNNKNINNIENIISISQLINSFKQIDIETISLLLCKFQKIPCSRLFLKLIPDILGNFNLNLSDGLVTIYSAIDNDENINEIIKKKKETVLYKSNVYNKTSYLVTPFLDHIKLIDYHYDILKQILNKYLPIFFK